MKTISYWKAGLLVVANGAAVVAASLAYKAYRDGATLGPTAAISMVVGVLAMAIVVGSAERVGPRGPRLAVVLAVGLGVAGALVWGAAILLRGGG